MTDGQFDEELVDAIGFGAASLHEVEITIDLKTGNIQSDQFAIFQLPGHGTKRKEPETGIVE